MAAKKMDCCHLFEKKYRKKGANPVYCQQQKNFSVARWLPKSFSQTVVSLAQPRAMVPTAGSGMPSLWWLNTSDFSSYDDSCAGAFCACALQSYVFYVFFRKAYCYNLYGDEIFDG
jgi:hypothetical protein